MEFSSLASASKKIKLPEWKFSAQQRKFRKDFSHVWKG